MKVLAILFVSTLLLVARVSALEEGEWVHKDMGTIKIVKTDEGYVLKREFPDGSGSKTLLQERKVGNVTRHQNERGEYWRPDSSGNLGEYDEMGFIRRYKRVGESPQPQATNTDTIGPDAEGWRVSENGYISRGTPMHLCVSCAGRYDVQADVPRE